MRWTITRSVAVFALGLLLTGCVSSLVSSPRDSTGLSQDPGPPEGNLVALQQQWLTIQPDAVITGYLQARLYKGNDQFHDYIYYKLIGVSQGDKVKIKVSTSWRVGEFLVGVWTDPPQRWIIWEKFRGDKEVQFKAGNENWIFIGLVSVGLFAPINGQVRYTLEVRKPRWWW